MQGTLPLVVKYHGIYRDKEAFAELQEQFELFDTYLDHEGFLLFKKGHDLLKTRMIVIPKRCFTLKDQSYRSDIVWMWKELSCVDGYVRMTQDGALSITTTNDASFYKPIDTADGGSFEEIGLLWSWIIYITSLSIYAQKMGRERRKLEECESLGDRLSVVARLLIERGSNVRNV